MPEFEQRLAKVREQIEADRFGLVPLLDHAQFTNSDVEAAAYVSPTQLHNWVSRGWIRLSGANPGKGRRRLYSGHDVIGVAIAAALQPFGMMQVAEQMIRLPAARVRAQMLLTGAEPYGYALAIVPEPDGHDWLFVPLTRNAPDDHIPTPSCVVIDLHRLILETAENLLRVIAGDPVPPRSFPKKLTEEESRKAYLRDMCELITDEAGNEVYAGLNVEESAEYQTLFDANWAALAEGRRLTDRAMIERFEELEARHEKGRQLAVRDRIMADAAKRHAAGGDS